MTERAARPETSSPPVERRSRAASTGPEPGPEPGPQLGSDYLIADPLFLHDGALHVRLGGQELPLLLGGQTIAHVGHAWRAEALFTGFAPLFLLELVHDGGGRATWFFDYRMCQVGDSVASLPRDLLDLLKLRAVPLLGLLTTQVLDRVSPALDPRVRAFLGVNLAMRLSIGVACLDELVRAPALYLADSLMPHALVYRGEDDVMRSIHRDHVAAGLQQDWSDRLAGFVRSGRMSWPSPVDGAPLHAQGGLVLDDFHFAFRFADPRHRLVFFVVVADHHATIGGVWFPSMGLMVSRDEDQRRLAWHLTRSLPTWIMVHLVSWADELIGYLAAGATRFASVMRGPPSVHIGHQLWNELSGIDRMVQDDPGTLPEWIVLSHGVGIELYGAIDVLFPELQGHVNRELGDTADLTRYAYRDGVFVLRVTGELVSAGLRKRIQTCAARSAGARRTAGLLPTSRTAPVILVGLRVENRTVVDLEGFLGRLVRFLADRFPGLVIVLDGHNSAGEEEDGVIGSHGERFASRRPVEVEHEIVAHLRALSADLPVTIADTIGAPISASLVWAQASDCFVSIWGASLAKYRWVCNKPGYVISGHANLTSRGDLHIYDNPSYMQDPSPLIFPEPDLVTDVPDAPQLVPVQPGNWGLYNFSIDEARMLPEIGAFIDRTVAARASAKGGWKRR